MPAVVVAGPRVDGRVGEDGVAEVALDGRPPLDLGHDGGVEANADVEQERRPLTLPRPMCGSLRDLLRGRRGARRSPRWDRWSSRWCGRRRWSTRPGSTPRAQSVPASPLAASLSVPSPAEDDDGLRAGRRPRPGPAGWRGPAGWSRPAVTSWSAASDFWITTRARAVTDEAEALTIRSSRTAVGRDRPMWSGSSLLRRPLGWLASERSWATLRVSSRDTCICEMPRRRAISDWVRPSKNRSWTTWRWRGGSRSSRGRGSPAARPGRARRPPGRAARRGRRKAASGVGASSEANR